MSAISPRIADVVIAPTAGLDTCATLEQCRKKRTSTKDPSAPDAKLTRMLDRRAHLAPKAEHAADLHQIQVAEERFFSEVAITCNQDERSCAEW